jgi:hypothetical protein
MIKIELTYEVLINLFDLIIENYVLSFSFFIIGLFFTLQKKQGNQFHQNLTERKSNWEIRLMISIFFFVIYLFVLNQLFFIRIKNLNQNIFQDEMLLITRTSAIICALILIYIIWFALSTVKVIKKNKGTLLEEFSHFTYKKMPDGYPIFMMVVILTFYNFCLNLMSYHFYSPLLLNKPEGREFAVKFEWVIYLIVEIISTYFIYRLYKKYLTQNKR